MVISVEGTFAYVFEVGRTQNVPLAGRLTKAANSDQRRLVGHAPVLDAAEYQREPWQLYSRITLTASARHDAVVASASFSVDRELIRALRAGDLLHIARTGCGGIGLSIVRGGLLVAAAGAIASVPLGSDVSVRLPMDLIEQAESIFRTRDPQYHLGDYPLQLSIEGETRIVHAGRPRIGPYDVLVRHGFRLGLPGTDACASIERRGVCPDTAAHTTAQLLESEGLQIADR